MTESSTAAAPACWQREAPSACLRVELLSGEIHLFAYQHFVTATLDRENAGSEVLRVTFSTHELRVEGSGLRNLLLSLQDFVVKWMRPAPERYRALPVSTEGVIADIRISAVE
jgi:hypothetical protein